MDLGEGMDEGVNEVDLGSEGTDEGSSIKEVTRFNEGVTHCEGSVLSSE